MNCIDCSYNLLKDGHYNCTYEEGECVKISVLEKENAKMKTQIEKMKSALERWYKQYSDKNYTETFYSELITDTEILLWSNACVK